VLKKHYIAIAILLSFTSTSFGSVWDCAWQGNFLKVAPQSDLVAVVKVKRFVKYLDPETNKFPYSMEVEIVEVLKGEISKKTVEVIGMKQHLLASNFIGENAENSTWVMALEKEDNVCAISPCGEYYLQYKDNKAFGITVEDSSRFTPPTSLQQLKKALKN
jgi:hypothetical protein